ncbi:hypothetical protein [Hathewaya massiliensis]|uniref:hypothetical protein n=1 Tax=Hathewaya massiliensis TaxID=1964382 RepID=UPI00115B94A6|nr:hypothetical protein [Hathewaya massiliensis]
MSIYDELKKAYGNHFQDVFSQIMKSKYGLNYVPTSTNGKFGDLKVDGVLNYITAFAVYAPEIYTDDKAIQKLKSDFRGFMDLKNAGKWEDIKEYFFVIKRKRSGITSTVINLISEFNKEFTVKIMTLDDIMGIISGYQPFSDDGILLRELKKDVTDIMEYVVNTDFASQPFSMRLADEIDDISSKWKKKRYVFSNQDIDNIKVDIIQSLTEICYYLTPEYVHPISDNQLLFNNDSSEAGEKLRNVLQPQILKMRCKVKRILDQLYKLQ